MTIRDSWGQLRAWAGQRFWGFTYEGVDGSERSQRAWFWSI